MNASGGSSMDAGASRVFSGDDEDGKEYKRWKVWVANKLLTLSDKVPAAGRGAFVYTLLSGKALECVEHLEPSAYQKEGGDAVLFQLLDRRFPQKEASDELSENLSQIFSIKATDGESLKAWISRASEAFDKLQRKTNVNFPEEARGWVILHRSGLSPDQIAVVLARSLGVLKRDEVGRAMRSCFPDFVCPRKKAAGVALVDEEAEDLAFDDDEGQLEDVEQFLAEQLPTEADDCFEEVDIADVLAVSWKEKRKELNRLQRSRRFQEPTEGKSTHRYPISPAAL